MAHGFNDNKTKFNIDAAGHTIKNELGALTQRKNLKFVGATVTDRASDDETRITIPSGADGLDISNDTLYLKSGNTTLDSVTLPSGADGLDFNSSNNRLSLMQGNTTLDYVTLPSGGGGGGAFIVEKETTAIEVGSVYSTGTGKRYFCDFDFRSTYPYSDYVVIPISFDMDKYNGASSSHLAGCEMISNWGVSAYNQYGLFRLNLYDGNKDGIDRKPSAVTGIFAVIPR